MSKDVRAEYHKQYDKANTVGLYIKLNKKTDADILAALESVSNKQGLIKRLLRAEIALSNCDNCNNDCVTCDKAYTEEG